MVGALIMAGLAWTASQTEPAEPRLVPTCTLVAPNGDMIGFKVNRWDSDGRAFGLVATQGSAWPGRNLVGLRLRSGGDAYAVGGENGLVLQIGEREGELQPAVIYRREGERIGLPLAHGFCRQEAPFTVYPALDSGTDPAAIGDDIAAFDPQRWPADRCALLLDDGRRFDLRYRLEGGRAELASPELWPDGPVRASLQRGRSRGGVGRARFSRRGGPVGVESFYVARDYSGAVKLLRLEDLGGASATGRTGFAICGYNQIERRPTLQAR